MENKLELIKNLKLEINNLVKKLDKIEQEYNISSYNYKKLSDEIDYLNKNLDVVRSTFNNIQNYIATKNTVLVGIASSFIILLICYFSMFSIDKIFMGMLFVTSSCVICNICLNDLVFNCDTINNPIHKESTPRHLILLIDKLEKCLLYKYPRLKKLFDEKMTLLDTINNKKSEFDKVRDEKDSLYIKYDNEKKLLSEKRYELEQLEGNSIDKVDDKTIIIVDEKDSSIDNQEKCKRRVRILEDDMSLDK